MSQLASNACGARTHEYTQLVAVQSCVCSGLTTTYSAHGWKMIPKVVAAEETLGPDCATEIQEIASVL